jgi:glycine/D-amino acid oxidase-like deaminating enzyme
MTFPDVLIIGGGIMGCSCAYYLSRAGVKVHLIDKGPIGSGASKAGMSHVVTWEEPEIHLDLAFNSDRLYQELSQELPIDIQYRKTGSIAVIENPEGLAPMQGLVERLQRRGMHSRMLSSSDLVELEPNLAPDLAGGALFEDDAQVNPLYAAQALAAAVRDRAGVIQTSTEVIGLELAPGGAALSAVVTDKGRIPAKCVVIAAGAWSGLVGKLAGIEIPVSPRKGTLVVTSRVPESSILKCKTVFSAGYLDSIQQGAESGIAVAANLQQTQNGNLLLGSSRQFAGFDLAVDPRVVSLLLSRCIRFFPALANITALRIWSGLRPYTPDLLPIISPVESIAGLYIAAGHEGIGITEGPITGKLISQMITGDKLAIQTDKLSLSRFVPKKG